MAEPYQPPSTAAVVTPLGILQTLTQEVGLVLFSYSPIHQALISWSDNISQLLGAPIYDLAREGNLFLRYLPTTERFRVLPLLDAALKGESPLWVTYSWQRPDTSQIITIHCRGALNTTLGTPTFEGFMIELG